MRLTPLRMIILGVILMVYASVITFVMAVQWIPSTLFLNFSAAVGSIAGLTIGFYGLFQMTRPRE
jgi:hypothetical protein